MSLYNVSFNVKCEGCAYAIAGNVRAAIKPVEAVFVSRRNEQTERFDNEWTHTIVSCQDSPKPMSCPIHGVPIDFRLEPSEQKR